MKLFTRLRAWWRAREERRRQQAYQRGWDWVMTELYEGATLEEVEHKFELCSWFDYGQFDDGALAAIRHVRKLNLKG